VEFGETQVLWPSILADALTSRVPPMTPKGRFRVLGCLRSREGTREVSEAEYRELLELLFGSAESGPIDGPEADR
jgi:hypothetical protein